MKGTASFGRHSGKKSHIRCRRCGQRTYHIRKNACSSCAFGKSPKLRNYAWLKKN